MLEIRSSTLQALHLFLFALAGLSSVDAIAFATSQGSAIISIGHGDEAERKKTHSTWEALVLLEWQVRNTAICKATSKKRGDFGQPSTCCWWAEAFFLVEHGLRVKTQRERKKTPTGGWQENIEPMQTRKHMTRWNQAIWLACWYKERDSAVFHNWTEPYDSDIIARRFQCHSRLAMPAMSATNSCTNDTELADHDKRVSHDGAKRPEWPTALFLMDDFTNPTCEWNAYLLCTRSSVSAFFGSHFGDEETDSVEAGVTILASAAVVVTGLEPELDFVDDRLESDPETKDCSAVGFLREICWGTSTSTEFGPLSGRGEWTSCTVE
jgi:hypothetical protein